MGIMSEMALEQWERDSDFRADTPEEPAPSPAVAPATQEQPDPAEENSDILAALRQMVSEEPTPAATQDPKPASEAAPAEKSEPEQTAADEEARKKAEHEAAEAKRKAEFDAKQAEKKAKLQAELDKVAAMSDSEVTVAGAERLHVLTERLTRRDMKTMVMETLTEKCKADAAFARLCMNPGKDMIKCFKYINRHARKYIEDLMKDRGETVSGAYGEDVPDDLCYQWAEDYFRDADAEEDKEQEEKFTPKPYTGGSSRSKSKKSEKKKPEPKKEKPKPEVKKEADNQISLGDLMAA